MTSITWDYPNPHLLPLTVDDQHLDAMRHTNNVVYLAWVEQVAWDHSHQLGLSWDDYVRLGHGMVARRHELDYLAPTVAGDQLLLATWIIRADRLSITRAYQFVRQSDHKTVFRGTTRWVCVDLESGRPRRLPAEFERAYQGCLVPSNPRPAKV